MDAQQEKRKNQFKARPKGEEERAETLKLKQRLKKNSKLKEARSKAAKKAELSLQEQIENASGDEFDSASSDDEDSKSVDIDAATESIKNTMEEGKALLKETIDLPEHFGDADEFGDFTDL